MERDMAELASHFQYLAYGEEVCPTTGRQHFQGFAYTAKAQRWSWYKKILGKTHFEKCEGSLSQNETYCSKEGTYIKYGTKPMGDGKKRSLAVFTERIINGEQVDDVAFDDAVTYVQYRNGLESLERIVTKRKLKQIPSSFAPEVIYIYGPARTGKTSYARDRFPDLYDVPSSNKYQWKNGYNGQDTVLFDNLDHGNFDATALLKEIDRYLIQVPTKGGFVHWRPRRVFLTSVLTPDEFATAFTQADEFLGRLTQTVAYPDYVNPNYGSR